MACLSDLIDLICRLWLAVFPIDPKIALREQTTDLVTREIGDSLVKEINYSLPSNTRPIEYVLNITADLVREEFKGYVRIEIEAIDDTNYVILHAIDLDIVDVTVEAVGGSERKHLESNAKVVDHSGILLITTTKKRMLAGCTYHVLIQYNGRMASKTSFGFAKHTFVYDRITKSKKTVIAATLLEPIFARKLLPCYDEPKYRTPVTLAIRKRTSQKIVTNLHVNYESGDVDAGNKFPKDDGNGVWVVFVKSKPMSICQLAFAIVDDEFEESTQGGKYVDYSAWTVKGAANEATFSMHHAEKTILMLEKLTKIRSPSTKFNMVQMQGTKRETRWDSVFFMQDRFLSDEKSCSLKHQQDTCLNVARQMSYAWFGGYALVETWHYPWLKDAFAVYLSYKLNEMIAPSWRMSDFQAIVDTQKVLYADGRNFDRPLTHTGEPSARDIIALYELPTYKTYNGKAALIIRMMEYVVGKATFERAVQRFLKIGHERGTVRPDILWKAFDQQVREDGVDLNLPGRVTKTIKSVMECWTRNVGYPLITARLENNASRVVITQTAYKAPRASTPDDNTPNRTWTVPITLATRKSANFTNTTPITWSVSDEEETILDVDLENDDWFLLNVQNTGYYRTNYSADNWESLIRQLQRDPTAVHPINRAQLVRDSHVLAVDGYLPLHVAVRLSTYLVRENDPIVWMAALDQFKIFYAALGLTARPVYKEHFLACLRDEYNRVGFAAKMSDDRPTRIWRGELLRFMCWLNDETCVKKAQSMYSKHEQQLLQIDPNFRFVVLCTMLRRQKLNDKDSEATINEILSRMATTEVNYLCEFQTFFESINCILDEEKYPDLVDVILNEMYESGGNHIETYMRGILSHWDTTAFVLKSIRNVLQNWSWTDKSTSKICLENLTKVILYLNLYGEIVGNPEVDILDEMISWLNTASNIPHKLHNELKDALADVRRKAERVGDSIDDDELVSLLGKYSCSSAKNEKSTFTNTDG